MVLKPVSFVRNRLSLKSKRSCDASRNNGPAETKLFESVEGIMARCRKCGGYFEREIFRHTPPGGVLCPRCSAPEVRRAEAAYRQFERERLAEERRVERERQAELRRSERIERERQAELRRIERERQAELRRVERERAAERRRAEQQERASRVPNARVASGRDSRGSDADVASQLVALTELFRQGVLTSEQFEAAKNKLLGLDSPTSPTGRNPKETIVIDGGNVIRTAGSADVTITVNGKTVQTSRGRIEENNSEDSAE